MEEYGPELWISWEGNRVKESGFLILTVHRRSLKS